MPFKSKNPLPNGAVRRVDLRRTDGTLKLCQGYVPRDLYIEVRDEVASQGRTITEIINWGFREFLLYRAPQRARKLGIKAGRKKA